MLKPSKSSSGSYRYLTHTTDSNDGKEKDKILACELLVAEYENRWQYEIYYWRRFRTRYRDKIKGTVRPRNWNLMKRYKKHSYKVRTGEILMS